MYITSDEIMKDSQPSNSFKQASEKVAEEIRNNPIDLVALRIQQDWSYLADKVVGAEE